MELGLLLLLKQRSLEVCLLGRHRRFLLQLHNSLILSIRLVHLPLIALHLVNLLDLIKDVITDVTLLSKQDELPQWFPC